MTTVLEFDAVVVGAGTAGANAAVQLSRRGLRVGLVERRAIGLGGARWCNGVLAWQFARAGIGAPVPVGPPGATHLTDPDGRQVVTLASTDVVDADMRALNAALVQEADRLGVRFLEHASEPVAVVSGGRVVGIDVVAAPAGGRPEAFRLQASLVVDASGLAAVVRRSSGLLDDWCVDPPPGQLCSAAQFTFAVTDAGAAGRYLESRGAEPGDTVTRLGADGGFSALAVTVHPGLDEVSVLTGTVATGEWGTGRDILDRFRDGADWIGEARFGGSGLIPLRRPHDRFTAPGLALVGDAACQVFPAHGSGIGVGLIAGTLLAEAVAGSGDPGAEGALWAYQARFQREFGATLAAYDVMRRMNSAAGADGVRALFRSGLFSPDLAATGLDQRWSAPPARELARSVRALAAERDLARHMVPALGRATAVRALYHRYPVDPDPGALRRWSAAATRLLP